MENLGIIELSPDEMITIDGGKSLPYYVGYGIGFVWGEVVSFLAGLGGGLNNHHI